MKIKLFPSGPLMVNTYLGIDEETNKCFIVDPGGYDKAIVEDIEENKYKVEYIILTHGHGDHIGGVEKYKEIFKDVKVISSKAEVELLENATLNESVLVLGKAVTITPDITVEDGEEMNIGDLTLKFIMTPGHTEGGMCILVGNVLFSGDTLFKASIGRTDFYGGSFEKLMNSIKSKLFILDDNVNVLPGHMETTTIGYEKEHNPFV